MEVKIITHTPDLIQTLFTAIRTCYSPYNQTYTIEKEFEKYTNKPNKNYPNDTIRLLAQISKMKHFSVFEHVSFTFAISNVSRTLLAQLTRHRIGWSYSVQSQRYVNQETNSKHGGFDYIIPPAILNNDVALNEFLFIMQAIQNTYNTLVSQYGIIPEDARYVLPNAATTNITVTCNLRAFADFYSKRNENTHSQWEIAELAETMLKEILEVEPDLAYLGFWEEATKEEGN